MRLGHVEYRFRMPPSCPKSRRNVGRAWAIDAPARHDLDAVLLESMAAAGLIQSAAQVCAGESSKVETIGMIGASVTLTELAILERSDRPGG